MQMIQRNFVTLSVLSVAATALLTGQAAMPTDAVRVIPYDSRLPIASRLLPSDRTVVVERNSTPPLTSFNASQTIDEGIDAALEHDVIVVAQGLMSSGILIDNATWIRGIVEGTILEVIQARNDAPVTKRIRFWHDDGEMLINKVRVRAGVYPVFAPQDRYLLLLGRDEKGDLYMSRAFRLTEKRMLGSLPLSNGDVKVFRGALSDRPEAEVLERLRRNARK